MRNAYAIVGIAGLIVFLGAAYAFNRSSTQSGDTVQNQARTDASISMAPSTLTLTSSAFAEGASIPSRFTCDGDRSVSPALSIGGVPEGTKSLVLIMDDPDIPQVVKEARGIDVFDHWVLYNIPAPPAGGKKEILEGTSIGTKPPFLTKWSCTKFHTA